MADTRAIFDALLAPSKNPLSGDTRQKVFKVMNDEELNAVIGYCLTQGPDREDRQEIAEFLLDKIAKKATESESNSNSDETQTSGHSTQHSQTAGSAQKNSGKRGSASLADPPTLTSAKRKRKSKKDACDTTNRRTTAGSAAKSGEKRQLPVTVRVSGWDRMLGECIVETTSAGNAVRFVRPSDILLWVPNVYSSGSWKSLSAFPVTLANDIQSFFYHTYLADAMRMQYYRSMARNPDANLERGFCVRRKVVSRLLTDGTYAEANGDISRACDQCIMNQALCVRLVKVDDELKLGLLPLPVQLRGGAKETETGYWRIG